jgi:hypothetical protein
LRCFVALQAGRLYTRPVVPGAKEEIMIEHDDPTRGEATGDEPAIEDPTREPSAPLRERVTDRETGRRRRGEADESEGEERTGDGESGPAG